MRGPLAEPLIMQGFPVNWRKSSWSANNGACVEVAASAQQRIGVRDSKNPGGPVLTVTAAQWQAFLRAAKYGAFDA
jgi:hypothetical protein